MGRKTSKTLTEVEHRLMDVLWERGPSTVGEVAEALPKKYALAYTSVLTMLRILEQKGYLRHTKEGRAFTYHPIVDRRSARRTAVKQLVNRFFNNSPELLVLNILETEELDVQELKKLKKVIEESE